LEILNRHTIDNDWVSFYLFFLLLFITLIRNSFPYHFKNFMLLIGSDNYLKTHLEDSIKKRLQILLNIFHVFAFSFIIYVFSNYFLNLNSNFKNFIIILGVYISFTIIKYIFETIGANLLKPKKEINFFNFQKQSYANYISIIYLIICTFIVYTSVNNPLVIKFLYNSLLCCVILIILLSLNNFRNQIFRKPYYFILYLCAFEIWPYIIGYQILKNTLQIINN